MFRWLQILLHRCKIGLWWLYFPFSFCPENLCHCTWCRSHTPGADNKSTYLMVGSKHLCYLDCYQVCLVKPYTPYTDLTSSHIGCACAQLVGFDDRGMAGLIRVLYSCFSSAAGDRRTVCFHGAALCWKWNVIVDSTAIPVCCHRGSVWPRSGILMS